MDSEQSGGWPTTSEGVSLYLAMSLDRVPDDRGSCIIDVAGLGDGGSASLVFDRSGGMVFELITAAGTRHAIRASRDELAYTLGEPMLVVACVGRERRKLIWRVRVAGWSQWHVTEAEQGSRLPSESQFAYVLGNSVRGDAGAFASFREILVYTGVKSPGDDADICEAMLADLRKNAARDPRVQFLGEHGMASQNHPNPPVNLKQPVFRQNSDPQAGP